MLSSSKSSTSLSEAFPCALKLICLEKTTFRTIEFGLLGEKICNILMISHVRDLSFDDIFYDFRHPMWNSINVTEKNIMQNPITRFAKNLHILMPELYSAGCRIITKQDTPTHSVKFNLENKI